MKGFIPLRTVTVVGALGLIALSSGCFFSSSLTVADDLELVKVMDSGFAPDTQYVSPGGRVRWEWAGELEHNVTWQQDSGSPGGNSPTQKKGEVVRLFDALGPYRYSCTLHGELGVVK